MSARVLSLVLLVGLAGAVFMLVPWMGAFHLPGNQQGYEPVQPINFSHRLHAGEMQISCYYCHSGATRSRLAGIPSANVCMNCHQLVTAPLGVLRAEDDAAQKEKREPQRIISPELQKLYTAMGLNEKLQPDPAHPSRPIAWLKVNTFPDFAYFDHRPHGAAGVDCQKCHGSVETMDRVKQVEDLSMGWCVNCHRDVNRTGVGGKKVQAPLDCSACHY